MQRLKLVLLIALLVLMTIGSGDLFAQDEEIFIGLVRSTEWNDAGGVTAAVLKVESEDVDEDGKTITYTEEFVINNDFNGKQLFELDGETVEVTCNIIENDDGLVYLKVISFNLVESDEEDFEEEEPEEPQK